MVWKCSALMKTEGTQVPEVVWCPHIVGIASGPQTWFPEGIHEVH